MTARFIAVCAYVGRPTGDGRALGSPYRTDNLLSGGSARRIVMRLEGQEPVQVGTIEHAGLIGDQVVLTGTFLQEDLARRLRTGRSVLTLDVNGPRTRFVQEDGRLVAQDWEISAAQLSDAANDPWGVPLALVWNDDRSFLQPDPQVLEQIRTEGLS